MDETDDNIAEQIATKPSSEKPSSTEIKAKPDIVKDVKRGFNVVQAKADEKVRELKEKYGKYKEEKAMKEKQMNEKKQITLHEKLERIRERQKTVDLENKVRREERHYSQAKPNMFGKSGKPEERARKLDFLMVGGKNTSSNMGSRRMPYSMSVGKPKFSTSPGRSNLSFSPGKMNLTGGKLNLSGGLGSGKLGSGVARLSLGGGKMNFGMKKTKWTL